MSVIRYGFPKLVLQITYDGDDMKELRRKAEEMSEKLKMYEPRYSEVIASKKESDEYWLV